MKRLPRVTWPVVAGRVNLTVMSVAFIVFGLSLALQSHRWESTPAYHILLQILRAPAWGVLFVCAGALLGLAAWQFHRRWSVIAALTIAFTLTTGWALSFVVRYLTSSNTTPETWVSWAVFDFLLLNVAVSLDRPNGGRLAPPVPPEDTAMALLAINEARSALARAEDAYARATGNAPPAGPDGP